MREITAIGETVIKVANIPTKANGRANKWNLVCDRAEKLRVGDALCLTFGTAEEARQATCSIVQAIKRKNLHLLAVSRGCDSFVRARP